MKLTKPLAVLLTSLLITSTSVFAGDHDKGERDEHSHHGNSHHHDQDEDRDHDHDRDHDRSKHQITAKEREAIQAWYNSRPYISSESKKSRHLPPGLAKKVARGGSLPPGWQEKIVVGQPVPPEIYEHCEPLPKEVAIKLPVPPVGTVMVTVEGKVARILEATHEILDVFDVIPKPSFPKALPKP
jgi:Ni/Co efflux regulator RcnB